MYTIDRTKESARARGASVLYAQLSPSLDNGFFLAAARALIKALANFRAGIGRGESRAAARFFDEKGTK